MRRLLLRLLGLLALVAAATLAWVVGTLPPAAARPVGPPARPNLIAGAYHIHSARSDGSGSTAEIAAAAAQAGLGFVIITDHGDATRAPDPPQYLHGVLVIDAVEISSTAGHVVALNLQRSSDYPLAGDTRDVVEDIHRMGGWAVAAHPDSPRQSLRWRAAGVAVDGVEWFNADSEWRAHQAQRSTLIAAAAHALFRAPEAIASLFRGSTASLARWDATARAQGTFTLAAVDAHARLGDDPDAGGSSRARAIAFPGYATMFRTVSQTVALAGPPTGDAAIDAAAVLAAIAAGRSYSVVRAFIDDPFALEFAAAGAAGRVDYGGRVDDAPVMTARVRTGTGARLVLLANGREVASGQDQIEFKAVAPGAYRVEARLTDRVTPWIVSNVIWVGPRGPAVAPPVPRPAGPATAIAGDSWVIESDRTSAATIVSGVGEIRVRYRLGPGTPAGQYAAMASSAPGDAAIERITFEASSTRPMRLSVQVRARGAGGLRWGRSIYVDATPRPFSIALADLDPLDRRSTLRPVAARVQSILLVVDTLNAKPGTEGEIAFRGLSFVAARMPDK